MNPGFTSHVRGLSRVESDGLLALLYAHCTQPELVLRHRWEPGDVVLWDNRATMHRARPYDDLRHRRELRRTTTLDLPA